MVLYTFTPNKPFEILIDISSSKFKFLETFQFGFSHANVWFTDQNSASLELEDRRINLTLVIHSCLRR